MHTGGIVMFAVIGVAALLMLAWYAVRRHTRGGTGRGRRR
jgi:hypothetical protein